MVHTAMHADNQDRINAALRFAAAKETEIDWLRRRSARARRDEQRAKSTTFALAFSLFLALAAGALLAGGHSVIEPLLQSAAAARDARRVGDVVFALPDGIYCRRAVFDNGTGELTGGGLELCPGRGDRVRITTGFSWGAH
jgi:hypothetical protein